MDWLHENVWNEHEQSSWSSIERSCRRQKRSQYPLSCNLMQKVGDLRAPGYSKPHRLKVMRVTASLSWTHIVRFRNSWWFIMWFFMSCSSIYLSFWALLSWDNWKTQTNKISQSNNTHNFRSYLILKIQEQKFQVFVAFSSICIGEITLSCI